MVRAGGAGTYTVANVQSGTGEDHDAGWSLVVAYASSTEPVRSLVVFDGFAEVANQQSVTINVSGFLTPSTGPVRTQLGVVAYEGDRGSTGDSLTLNGTIIADATRPSTNFFNSSITDLGADTIARNPKNVNQLGFDMARIDATGVLANGSASTQIVTKTTSETYFPAAITFSTELFSPRLDVVKSATDLNGAPLRPGDPVQYTLAVNNNGTDNSVGTVLTDDFDPGLTVDPGSIDTSGAINAPATSVSLSGQRLTIRLGTNATATAGGTFNIGDSATIRFNVTVPALGAGEVSRSIDNVAIANGTASVSGLAVQGSSNVATLVVTDPKADLAIAKVATAAQVQPGATAGYTLTVSNAGPSPAAGPVVVEDHLPGGWTVAAASGSGWDCVVDPSRASDRSFVRCIADTLAPGTAAPAIALTATVPANAAAATVTNTATVSSDTADPVPANNSAAADVQLVPTANLALEKIGPTAAVASQSLTYQLVASNAGPSVASGIGVTDSLPAGTSFVGAVGTGWTCTPPAAGQVTFTCALTGTLNPGTQAPTVTVTVDTDPAAPASITNSATVSGTQADPDASDNTATAGTTLSRAIDLAITLDRPANALVPGATPGPNLTALVDNLGPSSLPAGTPVSLTLTLSAGVVFAGTEPSQWA
jgi:uncharacterized repeat protein (TIGR01451 family)/fimbrial isopeptide formation D2 family protein